MEWDAHKADLVVVSLREEHCRGGAGVKQQLKSDGSQLWRFRPTAGYRSTLRDFYFLELAAKSPLHSLETSHSALSEK